MKLIKELYVPVVDYGGFEVFISKLNNDENFVAIFIEKRCMQLDDTSNLGNRLMASCA